MTSGQEAETTARYLKKRVYSIIERNYHTPACEIDSIARHEKRLYFVEVKYRGREAQGSGLDYITPTKRHQMARAAERWIAKHH